MSSYHHSKAIGLNFDAQCANAVLLRRRIGSWRIVDVLHLPWRQEGILTPAEQQRAIREWLADRHIGFPAACGGLPQPGVNTVISDFPPVHNHDQLSRMVEYQTRQLDGLSDEPFVHAFQSLIPLPGQTNPLLIAMSRQSLLEERLQQFQAMGLRIEQMTSTGLALVNAFETLQQDAAEIPDLQLVADFGAQSSVLAIYCQGRIQQLTTLATGFAPAKPEDVASLTHDFAREVLNILQTWKSTQADARGLQVPTQIWLSGTGALNADVPALLASDLQLSVHLLGLPARKCAAGLPTGGAVNGVCPALTIAFGLALQGTGTSPCSLSLIPERLAWQQQKRKASPFLFLTALLMFLALLTGLHLFNQNLRKATAKLQIQERELDKALHIIPKLEQAYQDIAFHQRKLLPIAETGFRAQRFMETLQVWLNALPDHTRDGETWCFYLADEFSFAQANTTPPTTGNATTGRRGARDDENAPDRSARTRQAKTKEAATLASTLPKPQNPQISLTLAAPENSAEDTARGTTPDAENAIGDTTIPAAPVFPDCTSVAQIPVLTAMYAGGFVPARENKYQIVKQMQERLNLSDTFVNVDDYADFLTPAFTETHIQPWQEFLTDRRDDIGQDFLLFFLQLPFREPLVKRNAN